MLVGTARFRLMASELKALSGMFEKYKISAYCTGDQIIFSHNGHVEFASIGKDYEFGASHPMFFYKRMQSEADSRRAGFGFDDTDGNYLPIVRRGILDALKDLKYLDEYTRNNGLEPSNVDHVALADL
ncbi:hypothetical protein [Microvirga flavescens]|uniref:hypothetical protein n=1 Tax=Microvirga flavescens TaxID=2249811 RepID=UPI000DD86D73|nr:hypothetical protein [Microvirga flavescens]